MADYICSPPLDDGATLEAAILKAYNDAAGEVKSVAGKDGAVTLVKADVGLGSVDNTSDVAKPVSTDTQTALDAKVDDSQVLTDVPAGAAFTDTTDHTALSNIGTNAHTVIDSHLGSTANPHTVTAVQAGAVANDDAESGASSVVNCVFITQANYDLLTPVATTLYVING